MEKQTCFIYCRCGNELASDEKAFISDEGEGGENAVKYKCSRCGKESSWNFDLLPIPVRTERIR